MSPLYQRRQELRDIERQELEGASFWTDKFSEATRNRLQLVMRHGPGGNYPPLIDLATKLLLSDLGQLSLYPPNSGTHDAFFRFLTECDDKMVPSAIEAFGQGYVHQFRENAQRQAFSEGRHSEESSLPIDGAYMREINRVLGEDRIAFEYIDGAMVPFASRELHVEVVQPVLRLLARPGWDRVERSYQEGLAELSAGRGANAITDAGTALQEALSLSGAEGNQLGDLIGSAKKRGIIASHDVPLLNVIERACHWASADRSKTGDAHFADPASSEDAWFTIHVVGAIILRLANGSSRAR